MLFYPEGSRGCRFCPWNRFIALFVVGLLAVAAVPTTTLTRPAALPTLLAAVAAVLGLSFACRGSRQRLCRWEVDIWPGEVVRADDHAPLRPRPSLSLPRHRPRLSRCVSYLTTAEVDQTVPAVVVVVSVASLGRVPSAFAKQSDLKETTRLPRRWALGVWCRVRHGIVRGQQGREIIGGFTLVP